MDSSDSSGDDRKAEEQFSNSSNHDIDLFMNNLDLSGIDFIRKANSTQAGSQKPVRGTGPVSSVGSSPEVTESQYPQPYQPYERSTPPELRDWSAPRVAVSNTPSYYPVLDPNVMAPRGVAERQPYPSAESMNTAPPSQRPMQQSSMALPLNGPEKRPSYGPEAMGGGVSYDGSPSTFTTYASPPQAYQRAPSPGWISQQQQQQQYPTLQQHQHQQQTQHQAAYLAQLPQLQQPHREVEYGLGVSFDQMTLRGGEDPQQMMQVRYPPRYPPVPQQQLLQQQQAPQMMPQQLISPPSYLNMHQQQQYQVQQQPQQQQQQQSYNRPVLQMPQPPQLITRSPPRQQTFRQQTHTEVFPSGSDIIYQVQFKRTFMYFVYYADTAQAFEPGDFVITECDRGEDLGMVVNIINLQIYHEHKHQDIKFLDEEVFRIRQIIRLATRLEREQLPIKYHDEQTVLQHCIEVVRNVFMLPMNIIDAEYQYDRTKLSIYYVSDVRIDFREIVRHVFSTFQTRIWMKKSNRELNFEPVAYAVAALATGVAPNKASIYRGDLGRGVGTPLDSSNTVTSSSGIGSYASVSGGTNSPFLNNGGGY